MSLACFISVGGGITKLKEGDERREKENTVGTREEKERKKREKTEARRKDETVSLFTRY